MLYQTYPPHPDLASVVKCYWILEVPSMPDPPKQRIVPDGCIEMIFSFGDGVKRFWSESEYSIQSRAMILGQIVEPMYIQPIGYVNSFAVRFYPYGFANFVDVSLKDLANKETHLHHLFDSDASNKLYKSIEHANSTEERIALVEAFLLEKLHARNTIDEIVKTTIDATFRTSGTSIRNIVNMEGIKRRQLERKFIQKIGVSPKQLSKVIRLQSALRMLLSQTGEKLTQIAYDSDYYDQAHFIKDFREFTGSSPKEFLGDSQMILSSIFYTPE